MLLFLRAPFLFGYAKPVPVNFSALNHPRRDMVLVAVAGPATNIVLATLAALFFHLVAFFPTEAALWLAQNLRNALIINVVLAVFNMIPLPPLDGGRVAVGLLPNFLALPLARLEPYGVMILLTLMLFAPILGAQMGVDLNIISRLISGPTDAILGADPALDRQRLTPSRGTTGYLATVPLCHSGWRPGSQGALEAEKVHAVWPVWGSQVVR